MSGPTLDDDDIPPDEWAREDPPEPSAVVGHDTSKAAFMARLAALVARYEPGAGRDEAEPSNPRKEH